MARNARMVFTDTLLAVFLINGLMLSARLNFSLKETHLMSAENPKKGKAQLCRNGVRQEDRLRDGPHS